MRSPVSDFCDNQTLFNGWQVRIAYMALQRIFQAASFRNRKKSGVSLPELMKFTTTGVCDEYTGIV